MKTVRKFLMLLVPIIAVGYFTTGCNHSGGSGGGGGGAEGKIILCLGDSITRGLGTSTPYPSILAGITGAANVINAGSDGERSGEGAARIGSLLSRHKPDIVCIMYGANDAIVGIPAESTIGNLTAIVGAVNAFGARAVVGQVTPQTGPRAGNAGAVAAINDRIGSVGAPIAGTFGAVGGEANLPDGLHPNDLGHSGMAGAFADAL